MAEFDPRVGCCAECSDRFVCRCLCVTEEMVADAIFAGARSFTELSHITDAGNGCTICHGRLRECLTKYVAEAEMRDAQRQTLATV